MQGNNVPDEVTEKPPMIERLQRIASLLSGLRLPILLLAMLFLGLFVFSLFQQGTDRESAMLPALVGFLWAVLLYSFSRLFAEVPERPQPQHGWRQRLSLRLRRWLMSIIAILVILLTLAVLVLSWQLLRTSVLA